MLVGLKINYKHGSNEIGEKQTSDRDLGRTLVNQIDAALVHHELVVCQVSIDS